MESAGLRDDTGYTVTVKHSGGYRSTYGFLEPEDWQTGDWVKAGEVLGIAEKAGEVSRLYFALMKDQQFIDPTEVIAFD